MNQTDVLDNETSGMLTYMMRSKDYIEAADIKEIISSLKEERPRRIKRISVMDPFLELSDETSSESDPWECQNNYQKSSEDENKENDELSVVEENKLSDEVCAKKLNTQPQYKIITQPAAPRQDVDYDTLISKLRACGLSEAEIFPVKEDHDEKGPGGYSLKRLAKLSKPKPEQPWSPCKPNKETRKNIRKPEPKFTETKNTSAETNPEVKSLSEFAGDHQLTKQTITEEVKPIINKGVISERLNRLAQPRIRFTGCHIVDSPYNVSNAAKKGTSSLRLQQLAVPKSSLLENIGGAESSKPPPVTLSRRIERLAKPKIVPYIEPDDLPLPRPVSKFALNAVASARLTELARPK